jgi:hypothetical protein
LSLLDNSRPGFRFGLLKTQAIHDGAEMESTELHDRLLEEAPRYEPPPRDRSLLLPNRDALVLWRAKSVSYEEISANFAKRGLKVSPSAVGVFCRNRLSKAETERTRLQLRIEVKPATPANMSTWASVLASTTANN